MRYAYVNLNWINISNLQRANEIKTLFLIIFCKIDFLNINNVHYNFGAILGGWVT